MEKQLGYLMPNVKFEPLIWRWYAWSHLISPLTAGCNVAERHIKIMESFIQAPHIHEESLKIPELLGGPFADIDKSKVSHVEELLRKTYLWCQPIIQLSTEYKQFDRYLKENTVGSSLEEQYKIVPESLRGMVELFYDGHNNASVRLVEPLVYHHFYNKDCFCGLLSFVDNDKRPFLLSTPRLEEENEIGIQLDFSSKIYDELFLSRYKPIDVEKIFDKLALPSSKFGSFRNFFNETQLVNLPPDRNYIGDKLRVRYIGHAGVLLQTRDVSILIDPVISYHYPVSEQRYTYYDLPDVIDYVLLTHNHQDHVQIETLIQLRHKVTTVVVPANNTGSIFDPSLKLVLQKLGFSHIISLCEFETIPLVNGEIMALPFLGEHADLPIYTKTAFCIFLGSKKLLFAADSNNLAPLLYKHVHTLIGNIDVIFLGMECDGAPLSWVYGPLMSEPIPRKLDASRRLSGSDSIKALELVNAVKCKEVYVYAMGLEPWLSFIMALQYNENSKQLIEADKFIACCREQGRTAKRLYLQDQMMYDIA